MSDSEFIVGFVSLKPAALRQLAEDFLQQRIRRIEQAREEFIAEKTSVKRVETKRKRFWLFGKEETIVTTIPGLPIWAAEKEWITADEWPSRCPAYYAERSGGIWVGRAKQLKNAADEALNQNIPFIQVNATLVSVLKTYYDS